MNKTLKENKKKQIVKIPFNIEVFLCDKKKFIIFKGPSEKTALKMNPLVKVRLKNQLIEVKTGISKNLSNYTKKRFRNVHKTTASLLKQFLVETAVPMYQKLNFVGVGYKVFPVKEYKNQLFFMKLGYSHSIYFKIPLKTSVFCLNFNELVIYGHSHGQVISIAADIRSNKVPDKYKGKGILYGNEVVVLKEGKKI